MNNGLLLSYFILGLTLAAPIGPVNSSRLDKGIKNGFWHAWMVGFGSMLADFIYMTIIYFGLANFIQYLVVQVFLWLFGGFILIYSGVEGIVKSKNIALQYSRERENLFKCFLQVFY